MEAFNVTPLGKAPPAVIEQVEVPPLLTTVGVIERAVPTVPVTELGEKLMVGGGYHFLTQRVGLPWL